MGKIMHFHQIIAQFIFAVALTGAVELKSEPVTLNLWSDDYHGIIRDAGAEKKFPKLPDTVANVSIPAMTVYLPEKRKSIGIALVYCSGGSYNKVSYVSDYVSQADYFVSKGVAVIVVKYRTLPPSKNVSDAMDDGLRAVRIVRYRAKEWGINPAKIGMLGGSAGANLILNAATHWDNGKAGTADPVERVSSRPDFIVLLCPWPNKQLLSDFVINETTPPALLCSAHDDKIAPTAFADGIVAAYKKAGVPATLWTIEKGGHTAFKPGNFGGGWKEQLWSWLENIGIIAK